MANIKFYYGNTLSQLPANKQEGALYVIKDASTSLEYDNQGQTSLFRGDLYADIGNSRVQILSQTQFNFYLQDDFNDISSNISTLGTWYVIYHIDPNDITGKKVIDSVRVGDGSAHIIDLPTLNMLSDAERAQMITAKCENVITPAQNEDIHNKTDYRLNLALVFNNQ